MSYKMLIYIVLFAYCIYDAHYLYRFIIIHFIYRRLQLLVKNILIQIVKEIHSYH